MLVKKLNLSTLNDEIIAEVHSLKLEIKKQTISIQEANDEWEIMANDAIDIIPHSSNHLTVRIRRR